MDIKEKIYKAINKQEERAKGIHVSHLVYDCVRRGYYDMTHDNQFFNLNTLITFWLGRAIHTTPFLDQHEVKLEWEGIHGTCDDYGDGILLDKKTCTQIPRAANKHHVKQLEYYKVMMENREHRMGVDKAYVVYIDIANKKIEPMEAKMRKNETIEKEMLEKKAILDEAIKNNKPPKRNISWLCSYCNFANICFGEGENVKTDSG